MNHSTAATTTTTPAESITSKFTAAETRPRVVNSEAHRAIAAGGADGRADTRSEAGLRNFDSIRRTTGTKPSQCTMIVKLAAAIELVQFTPAAPAYSV